MKSVSADASVCGLKESNDRAVRRSQEPNAVRDLSSKNVFGRIHPGNRERSGTDARTPQRQEQSCFHALTDQNSSVATNVTEE